MFADIRETGDLSEDHEATLRSALEAFGQMFQPSSGGPGSEAGLGAGTPPDDVKPDVGWDRMSSADETGELEAGGEAGPGAPGAEGEDGA